MKGPILSIETSTRASSVAISVPDRVLADLSLGTGSDGGRHLSPAIRWMMAGLGLGFADLGAIAVSQGPGSFTGLRIGMSLAKALAQANRLPLFTAGSLLLTAYNASLSTSTLYPLLDARRGEVYAAAYRFEGGGFIEAMSPRAMSPSALLPLLRQGDILVGEGAIRYRTLFLENGNPGAAIAPPSLALPRASHLADLVFRGLVPDPVEDVMALEPLYVRMPEAELRWKGAR